MRATIFEHFKGVLFHVFPHHVVSRLTFVLSRLPTSLAQPVIRAYIRFFDVDMSDALKPDVKDYACFNDFFTRRLRPEARPVCAEEDAQASPCDATVLTFGRVEDGKLPQIKGLEYTVEELLADAEAARTFRNAHYCTLYLSPSDYHRVHMPASGRLRTMIYAPGRLFSVARYARMVIPRLFARNERVAALFDGERGGFAVVMVGALNVGCIEIAWHGVVAPAHASHQRTDYAGTREREVSLQRGDEMGCFNTGSTVVLLFEADKFEWAPGVAEGSKIKVGEALGRFVAG